MCKCEDCEHRRYERVDEPDGTYTLELVCEEGCPYDKCAICEERIDDDYICEGVCYECAKDVYTDALGVEFLYHPFNKGKPNEFTVGEDFVKYYFSDDDLRSSLAQDMLLSSLLISIHMDCALNRNSAERKALKAFCLEECDIELWIDYLKASGACDV